MSQLTANQRYSGVSMLLHWLIAVAVIVNWRLIEAAEHAEVRADAFAFVMNHKSLGITILALTLLRLGWRLINRPPPLRAGMAAWEKALARTLHIVFYVLLVGLPMLGWLSESFEGEGIEVWGMFTLPGLPVGVNEQLAETMGELHGTGGEIMIYLIGLHVLGMLKHMLIDKDGNLWRMLPFGTPKA
ncbi:cytochrome b [Aurantiacibacter gilvus]|uniref:Cytochrome b n=1 Tax=Aurantiacibacter gilvus TaxID=3139141 RepID=A0ABU9IBX2_9SPHN